MAPVTLPASATPGQHGALGSGVFEWAVYQSDEVLTSNGEPIGKCFWNRAIGLDRAALRNKSCRLTGVATASMTGVAPPPHATAYPVVRFDVEVLKADGTLCGRTRCSVGFLGSGVGTDYVDGAHPPSGPEAFSATFTCTACGSATDATCDGVDDDCDGSVDEDYLPTTSSCGVGVCVASGTRTCVDGVVVDSCEPGEPEVGVHSFDGNASDVVIGATFYGNVFQDIFTGTFTWWSPNGGVGDSGYWYGVANPLTTYATTLRHYSLAESVSARRRVLGGRIEAAFKRIGGPVRAFSGTESTARARWFITARSSNVATNGNKIS